MSLPAVLCLHQVMLPTRAVAFYRELLGAEPIAVLGDHLAFFDLGGPRLLLERSDAPTPATLYPEVDDTEAACAALRERGGTLDSEPHRIHTNADGTFGAAGTQEWMAFFCDPDGTIRSPSPSRAGLDGARRPRAVGGAC